MEVDFHHSNNPLLQHSSLYYTPGSGLSKAEVTKFAILPIVIARHRLPKQSPDNQEIASLL